MTLLQLHEAMPCAYALAALDPSGGVLSRRGAGVCGGGA